MGPAGVLLVAGEASGDRIAGLAARELAKDGARLFGVGGSACRAAGVELVASTEDLGLMGLGDAVARLPPLGRVVARLAARVARRPPRAALLVNYTELNQRLGAALRRRGVKVLWCVAPQAWAWRPGRLHSLGGSFDRLAVILPFEEPLWRGAGHDARFVGHPSLEIPTRSREELRARLGVPPEAEAIAVLPGSRAGEIARLAPALTEAASRLRAKRPGAYAAVIVAPGLSPEARAACLRAARSAGLPAIDGDPDHGAAPLLPAFDVSLVASGTASLEAALAGASPVVTYRLGSLSYAVARCLVKVPHIALPNVLLGRRAYPEVLQDDLTPERLTREATRLLERRDEAVTEAAALRALLRSPSPHPFGARVAALVRDWL